MYYSSIFGAVDDDDVLCRGDRLPDASPTGEATAEMKHYQPIKPVGNSHGVSFVCSSRVSAHDLQCMQHGCTVLRWDASTSHFTPVLLRLENDTRTLSWSPPTWATLRPAAVAPQGPAGTSSASGVGTVDPNTAVVSDVADPRLSPALLARHQLQLPYRVDDFDDGFVDLAVVKEFSVGSGAAVDVVSLARRQAAGGGGSSVSSGCSSGTAAAVAAAAVAASAGATSTRPSNCLMFLFGVGLSDNRVVEFVAPSHVARLWKRGLSRLVAASQRRGHRSDHDRRVLWLKEQYLQLYFDGGRCHGPTPAEAIRVRYFAASISSSRQDNSYIMELIYPHLRFYKTGPLQLARTHIHVCSIIVCTYSCSYSWHGTIDIYIYIYIYIAIKKKWECNIDRLHFHVIVKLYVIHDQSA